MPLRGLSEGMWPEEERRPSLGLGEVGPEKMEGETALGGLKHVLSVLRAVGPASQQSNGDFNRI